MNTKADGITTRSFSGSIVTGGGSPFDAFNESNAVTEPASPKTNTSRKPFSSAACCALSRTPGVVTMYFAAES